MSIQTELTRITNAKAAIKTAIEGKGVTVPDGTLLDGMASLIESIEAGGGGSLQGFKFMATGTITPAADISSNYTVNVGGAFGIWDVRYTVICLFPENIRSFVTKGTINFIISGNTRVSSTGGATSYFNSSGAELALSYGLIDKPSTGTDNYSFTINCSSSYKMIASNTYRWVMLTREDQTV